MLFFRFLTAQTINGVFPISHYKSIQLFFTKTESNFSLFSSFIAGKGSIHFEEHMPIIDSVSFIADIKPIDDSISIMLFT